MKRVLLFLVFVVISTQLFAEKEWVTKHKKIYEVITEIECLDSNDCYAFVGCSDTVRIYRSTDQGNTWNAIYDKHYVPLQDSVWTVSDCYVLDSNHMYLSFVERVLIDKSTDGGKTFERITFGELSTSENYVFDDITMYNENIGAILMNRGIITTIDGWKSYQYDPYEDALKESAQFLFFLDSNNLLMPKSWTSNGFKTYNIKTQEYSDYSEEIDTNEAYDKKLYDIYFVSDSVLYGCGGQVYGVGQFKEDIIYKSTDRGKNWKIIYEELKEGTFAPQEIAFENEKHGIAIGSWGKLMETQDSGKTWEYLEATEKVKVSVVVRINFAGKYALIGTNGGGILRFEEISSLRNQPKNIFSIHPNPAGDYIDISLDGAHLEGGHHQKVEIYDVLGNVVLSDVRHLRDVEHLKRIDVSQLPKGVYFVKIGDQVEKFIKK